MLLNNRKFITALARDSEVAANNHDSVTVFYNLRGTGSVKRFDGQ